MIGTDIRSSVFHASGHMEIIFTKTSPSSAYFCALAALRIMSRGLLSATVQTYGTWHAAKICAVSLWCVALPCWYGP